MLCGFVFFLIDGTVLDLEVAKDEKLEMILLEALKSSKLAMSTL